MTLKQIYMRDASKFTGQQLKMIPQEAPDVELFIGQKGEMLVRF